MCQVMGEAFFCITSFDPDSILIKYEASLHEVQGGPENGKSSSEGWAIYPTACTPKTAALLSSRGTSRNNALQSVGTGKLALVGVGQGEWGDPDL